MDLQDDRAGSRLPSPPQPGLILPPSGLTPVTFRPSLLREARETRVYPEGITVAAIVADLIPDAAAHHHVNVALAGHRLPQQHWHRIRPKNGAELTLVLVPAGQREILFAVLAVVIIAASMGTGSLLVAGGYGAFTAAAASAAISTGGFLALNALLPPAAPELGGAGADQSSPTYALDSTQNTVRKWQPIPILLGRHRLYPPLGAETITEASGDTVFLSTILCWGQGPIQLEDYRLGETALGTFQGVNYFTHTGVPGVVPTMTFYTRDVHQETIGARLKKNVSVVRATQELTKGFVVEFFFPSGLIHYGKQTGDQIPSAVDFKVEVSGHNVNNWVTVGMPVRITARSTSAQRKTFSFLDLTPAQYDIRVTRLSDDTDGDPLEVTTSVWGILRSYRDIPPIRTSNLTLTELKVKATDQLNGSLDTVNAIGTMVALDWNWPTQLWVQRATRNPASALLMILMHPNQPRPLDPASEIDMPALQAWHEYCASNAFTCDIYLDWAATEDEVIDLICVCGRARAVWVDGKRSVFWDHHPTVPVQRFTARNVRNFASSRIFLPPLHGYRIPFVNELLDWQPDERIVYFDGYNADNATQFEELEARGITHPDRVWRYGRWMYMQYKLRPETLSFDTDWEWLACRRGDLIEVQHPMLRIGVGAARVITLVRDGANQITALYMDDSFVMAGGSSYVAIVHGQLSGGRQTFPLLNHSTRSRTLTPTPPLPAIFELAVGDLVMVGISGIETHRCLVKDIMPRENLECSLTVVPAQWADETKPIPDFLSNVTPRAGSVTPLIMSIRSDEQVAVRDADGSIRLTIMVAIYNDGARSNRIQQVQVAWRRTDNPDGPFFWASFPAEATQLPIPHVQLGSTYGIGVRYILDSGIIGLFSPFVEHTVVGAHLAPPDVAALWLAGDWYEWSYPQPDVDHAGFLIRWSERVGAPWEEATSISDSVFTELWIDISEVPDTARELLIKAVTHAEIESVNATRAAVDGSALRIRGVAEFIDLTAGGTFPADTITGAVVEDDQLKQLGNFTPSESDDPGETVWADPPGAQWGYPGSDLWGRGAWADIEWIISHIVNPEALRGDRLFLQVGYVSDASAPLQIYGRYASDEKGIWPDETPLPDELLAQPDNLPLGAFSAGETKRPWHPWVDGIPALPGVSLQLRFHLSGGTASRSAITSCYLARDAVEILLSYPNQFIASADPTLVTGVFFAATRKLRGLIWVHGTLQEGGVVHGVLGSVLGTPRYFVVDAKSAAGANVHLEDDAGNWVDGTADITFGGY